MLTDPGLRGGSDGRSYLLTGTHPTSFPEVAAVLTADLARVHTDDLEHLLGRTPRGIADLAADHDDELTGAR